MVWILLRWLLLLRWEEGIEVGCGGVRVRIVDLLLGWGDAGEHGLVNLLLLLVLLLLSCCLLVLRVGVLWLLDVLIHIEWIVRKHFADVYVFPYKN